MKIRILAAIATLATAACQQDLDRDEPTQGADLPTSEVRDSAGILITENARPPDGSRLGWRIGPEPTVTIGAVEGEDPYLFQWVRSAFRISDGRIVVANGGTEEIRVFTATGTHLLSWGGKGAGSRGLRQSVHGRTVAGRLDRRVAFGQLRGLLLR